ncbi:hypothetical protein M433DRAFT_8789 [Acidomyces richmondensis BFW]|nr:hypothetical protein M433DRAFT_8789 [Acidomyces richmondensis BFW]
MSEYIAMTLTAREAAALILLLKELRSADVRTKHIDFRWHYICQEVDLRHIMVKRISTHKQAADGLTKAFYKVKSSSLSNSLEF